MKRGIEIKAFHAIWWTLAVLLPDLLGLALRDWRAAVAGAGVSVVMIALSLRLSNTLVGATSAPTPDRAETGAELLAGLR